MSETTLLAIPLDRIIVGERLRPVDADYVALLAASMEETGQHTPIDVGPADDEGRHPLIAGAHRCAAAALAGLPSLLARVFEGDEDGRKLLEIDENLMRRELSELERAVFLAQRKVIYQRLHPETGRGKALKGKREENFLLLPGQESFAAATARKLGVTKRQVDIYVARARTFERAPELREPLARSRWADHGAVLDELAKVTDPSDLRRLVQALLRAERPAANLRAAQLELGLIRDNPTQAEDAEIRRLDTAWRKAGPKAKKAWLVALFGDLSAQGVVTAALNEAQRAAERRQDRVLRALPTGEAA